MAEPVVQFDTASYKAFWMWAGVAFGAGFTLAFWLVGYWVVRIAVASGISDAGVLPK